MQVKLGKLDANGKRYHQSAGICGWFKAAQKIHSKYVTLMMPKQHQQQQEQITNF